MNPGHAKAAASVVSPESLPLPPLEETTGRLGVVSKEYLDEVWTRLRTRNEAGASGREIVESHTFAMDRLIRFLYDAAVEKFLRRNVRVTHRCAVVAQGGYGRGELNPCSDVDLLFLYSWKINPFVESVTETMLYALWDTGIRIGHAVRNVRGCVRLASMDFKVKTALLDTRFLCGETGVNAEFERAMSSEVLRRNQERFFEEKIAESEQRHHAYGDTVYLQEPQIKEGEGGLRDLHTALWMARVKFKIHSLREMVHKGIVPERDYRDLVGSQDFLWRVRNTLHYLAESAQDQLTFEYQEEVARVLGYRDERERRAVECLMRDYYLHAGTVNRLATAVIERCVEKATPYRRFGRPMGRLIRPGMLVLHGGEIAVEDPEVLEDDPANIVVLFRESQRHRAPLGVRAKLLVRQAAPGLAPLGESPAVIEPFLAILREGRRVATTLREMHELEVLGQILPEFEQLRCMVIRDLYHIYTVDEHTLRAIDELDLLAGGEYRRSWPLLTQAMREIDRRDLVFLAMLLHDVGKGHGHGHSERGAELARQAAARLGLREGEIREVELLVRHHLLMSHIAQHRDLEDERLIVNFAKTVEDVETLKKLYVMTFADMRAVAPKVWNAWRDHLLAELYLRTLEVFEKGEFVEEDRASRVGRTKENLQEILRIRDPEGRERLEALLETLPSYYFLSASEESFVHHLQLLDRFHRSEDVAESSVFHFPDREFSEYTVCTRDRSGLFATLAGVLAANGMNIIGARIVTTADGFALDTFRLAHGERPENVMDPDRWRRVGKTLESALRGGSVESLVRDSLRPSILDRRLLPKRATAVRVDNEGSVEYTLIDVETEDRLGLLYDIARTLTELGLVIHVAKISTVLNHVIDVFYVADRERRKITAPRRIETVVETLRSRISGREGADGDEGGPSAEAAQRP